MAFDKICKIRTRSQLEFQIENKNRQEKEMVSTIVAFGVLLKVKNQKRKQKKN